jgi:hypothetical protein
MNDVNVPAQTQREVNRHASGTTGTLLEQMAERLGGRASAAAVYGSPVERDGVTVIPVARVAWGVGAGGGSGNGPDGQGSGSGEGGGGGVSASPVGFIEIKNGTAEFRPIRMQPPFWALPPIILAAGVASLLALHGLRRLLRG